MDSHQLIDLCATLNLHAIKDSLESRLKQARESKLSYEELLAFLFQDELESRQQKAFEQKVKQAQFEELKSFDNFDLRRYEDKTIQAIRQIMTGGFQSTAHNKYAGRS